MTIQQLLTAGFVVAFALTEGMNTLATLFSPITGEVEEVICNTDEYNALGIII